MRELNPFLRFALNFSAFCTVKIDSCSVSPVARRAFPFRDPIILRHSSNAIQENGNIRPFYLVLSFSLLLREIFSYQIQLVFLLSLSPSVAILD